MTTQNNAAQPVLTDDQIEPLVRNAEDEIERLRRALEAERDLRAEREKAADPNFVMTELRGIICVAGDSPTVIVSVERMRLWLSKLRAPVADERAAFEESYRRPWPVRSVPKGGEHWSVEKCAAWEGWKARAALASAPVADESLAVQALKAAQNNIAACRPPGSSDPKSPQYDHDAFMWDYYQRAIDSLALASAPVAGEAQPDDLNKRLLEATIRDLAAISEHLGLDPNEGGADPIIEAIDELRRERDNCVDAQYAAAGDAAPQASPITGDAQPTDQQEALRIAELPNVDEALSNFANDCTQDNAVGLVQAILDAAPQASEAVTDDMRAAVRFAPSSAHWSRRLVELFGPDAREGINGLEKQLREAQAELSSQQRAGDELTHIRAENERLRNGVDQDMAEVGRVQALYDSEWRKRQRLRAAFDHPVFAFLLGEGQLHGVDFGERAPGAVGKWWWRKDLRAALAARKEDGHA
ncbi:hypothetical protein L512_5219 [Bordetella bronchiseptica MBORD624]|uniref:hypothetical protein n=1 Tax=Bordetella bronchiseptica TaxID=518 RepID=UPI00046183C0|nr:hypothetical protein [Bordetella bronchiseptica]KDC59382.1 hypothetical protein L511_4157 [Bordetella bronchiseptica MBORD595]KDC67994.1 hypothetical protein L512_5219 [Bordetella bronchiseptica MBORD624]